MRKIIVFFFVLTSLSNFLYSMDDAKSPNIIKKAVYYSVYHPYNAPTTFNATFYRNQNKYPSLNDCDTSDIRTISFLEWNADQQSKLDAMVDPEENLHITHAKINWHNIGTCCGRNITYYNNDQFIAINSYYGPIDIKKDHLK